MSLPETEEFKAFQVSTEGQQESLGVFQMSAFASYSIEGHTCAFARGSEGSVTEPGQGQ
jgi:hypothetical protein